ncbi:nucleotide exchange factor GrpE [Algoriphagus hitonicola]|uniref:Protein GrpE n=1 Tax=Algoriphagus hitonicola TaxID=435880 RepID=A0A1I2VFT3_9BACT|nr:nucleotide exchange factor GrpE [Algoriphagus hitonicola]SFG88204.1 molecular chaperone GrpE [Algoriphagus hitonicola]
MKNKKEETEEVKTQQSTDSEVEAPTVESNSEEEKEGKEESNPLEKMEAELAEVRDKYLRLYSDFENYRKRNAKERLDLIKTASEEVLRDLIPVVDDFERAFKAGENETDTVKLIEGNRLVFQKLLRILENKGLKPMNDLIGKPFDADTQEAITQISAPSDEMKGKVIDVVEKGYTLGDKVVRFAKVVTGA